MEPLRLPKNEDVAKTNTNSLHLFGGIPTSIVG